MISLSAEALSVLTGSYRYSCSVESWLGGELLAADVPVDAAGEETDRTLRVPERVTLTVPRRKDGESWAPGGDDRAPLAAAGQQLHVKLGVGLSMGQTEWFARSRLLIEDSIPDGDRVSVTAVGLLTLPDEARLISPYQPSGTLVSTLRGLVEPALTVLFDSALVDRAVPAGINYDEDRLGAVLELLDAWGADAVVDPEGYLHVMPATGSTTPVLSLTDGRGGTVITTAGSSTRENASNVVVARGTASDGSQVQGTAYVTSGPTRFGGPFHPLAVPTFFSSPLLTSIVECTRAAETIRDRKARESAPAYRVEMVPHPALQVGDVVALTASDPPLTAAPCVIESLTLSYTNPVGTQVLKVRRLL
jgi:hypothetical protein